MNISLKFKVRSGIEPDMCSVATKLLLYEKIDSVCKNSLIGPYS